ncbi:MAG: winged helix-turn-helix transcriptional regulator [Acidimicrobiia bacterium]|nr:winged helix-turn-helix transcriptional regulator [Acidimicrobiia bacterium]
MQDTIRSFKAELFKALGHPGRLRIVELLRDGERSVSDLQAACGTDGSAVSQHLAVLRARWVVEARRDGSNVYYRVRHPRVLAILDAGREIFADHLDDLRASLDADIAAAADEVDMVPA